LTRLEDLSCKLPGRRDLDGTMGPSRLP